MSDVSFGLSSLMPVTYNGETKATPAGSLAFLWQPPFRSNHRIEYTLRVLYFDYESVCRVWQMGFFFRLFKLSLSTWPILCLSKVRSIHRIHVFVLFTCITQSQWHCLVSAKSKPCAIDDSKNVKVWTSIIFSSTSLSDIPLGNMTSPFASLLASLLKWKCRAF